MGLLNGTVTIGIGIHSLAESVVNNNYIMSKYRECNNFISHLLLSSIFATGKD